jgi:hypothetical protein
MGNMFGDNYWRTHLPIEMQALTLFIDKKGLKHITEKQTGLESGKYRLQTYDSRDMRPDAV